MTLRCVIALICVSLLASPAASETITPEQAKQAVKKALPFLRDSKDAAIKAGITGTGCASCHWGAQAIWSLHEAQHRSLVDRKELEKFDGMLKRLTTRKLVYQQNAKSFDVWKKAGVAEDKLALVKKVNQPFDSQQDLRKELAKVLPAEILDKHQEEVFKTAANPNHYSDPGDLVVANMLLAGAPSMTSNPAETSKGLVERL